MIREQKAKGKRQRAKDQQYTFKVMRENKPGRREVGNSGRLLYFVHNDILPNELKQSSRLPVFPVYFFSPILKPWLCLLLFAFCFLASCNSEYVQKPRGYFEIELPAKQYQLFDQPGFPYTFEFPVYGKTIKDSLFFEEKTENPYWINIEFPRFDARIYLSYKEIGKNKFDSLVNDAFTMAYKQHTTVATGINRQPFTTPNGYGGVYFTLKGNAATGNQFFITDSVKHFLRGALYFNATPNADSLAPVNKFLREDVERLINTLKWK